MGFKLLLGGEGYAIGGRFTLASYMFTRYYRRDMDVRKLNKLVAQSLYDTAKIDASVGEPFSMAIIREGGITIRSQRDINSDIVTWEESQT